VTESVTVLNQGTLDCTLTDVAGTGQYIADTFNQ
jgi:hypothetical protein